MIPNQPYVHQTASMPDYYQQNLMSPNEAELKKRAESEKAPITHSHWYADLSHMHDLHYMHDVHLMHDIHHMHDYHHMDDFHMMDHYHHMDDLHMMDHYHHMDDFHMMDHYHHMDGLHMMDHYHHMDGLHPAMHESWDPHMHMHMDPHMHMDYHHPHDGWELESIDYHHAWFHPYDHPHHPHHMHHMHHPVSYPVMHYPIGRSQQDQQGQPK
jgi:hypothetical protein